MGLKQFDLRGQPRRSIMVVYVGRPCPTDVVYVGQAGPFRMAPRGLRGLFYFKQT